MPLKTINSIGRLTLLKYCTFSVLVILTLFILTFLALGDPKVTTVSLDRAISTLANEFLDNLLFVVLQAIMILIEVLLIGGLIGELIIKKGRNKFLIGGLTLFSMWLLLFLTSAVTSGLMNSIKYGRQGFESAFFNWAVYGLIPFFVFGIIHGLTIGFFLGQEIKKRGEKLNAL